jgi:hypothetical protein
LRMWRRRLVASFRRYLCATYGSQWQYHLSRGSPGL